MDWLRHLLESTPPLGIYVIVGLVVGVESMGIPLPGEITLVTATLLAVKGNGSPWGVACAPAIGAIIGDSIGYTFGKRGGRPLLDRMGRKFPKHLGPREIAKAEKLFERYGTWAVFFGRFIALLRILAGPLAGALKVPYPRFLLANASGGIVWAFGTVWVIYLAGEAAERWLSRFSWIALAVAVAAGIATTWWLKNRTKKAASIQNV